MVRQMAPEHDTDDSADAGAQDGSTGPRRRSVLAGAGALAAGGVLGGAANGFDVPLGSSAAVSFGGNEHTLLGDATAERQNGSLVVRGFGDSGEDGIVTHLEQATEWAANVGATVPEMPVGATLTAQCVGNLEGETGQVTTTLRATRREEGVELAWDYPVANGNVAVEVLDEDGTVHVQQVDPDQTLRVAPDQHFVHIWFLAYVHDGAIATDLDGVAPAACTYEISDPGGGELQVDLGGEVHTGTSLRVMEDPREDTHTVWYTSDHRLTGTDLDALVIDSEPVERGVMFRELANNPVGDAVLTHHGEALEVGGVFDADGIYVELGSIDGVAVDLDPVPTDLADTELREEAWATVDGCAHKSLGHGGVRNRDGTLELFGDFGPLGTDAVDVRVFGGGSLVGTDIVADGVLGTLEGRPNVVRTGVVPGGAPGYAVSFDGGFGLTLSSGTTLEGDQIRLFPAEATKAVGGVEAYGLTGRGLDGFVVRDEQPIA